MTLAEELQRDADLAKDEGGMYYSGQYLQGYADRAHSLEAENTELRKENEAYKKYIERKGIIHGVFTTKAENERLRDMLSRLMQGVSATICTEYDKVQCERDCKMHYGTVSCTMTDAIDLCEELGIEAHEQ